MKTQMDKGTRIVYTTPPKRPPVVPSQRPVPPQPPSDRMDILRWTARVLGVCGAVLLSIILIADTLGGVEPIGGTVMLAIWLFLFLGVLLAFISDTLGGVLLIIGALASLTNIVTNGKQGGLIPYVVLFALDGVLFLFCGWRRRLTPQDVA